MKLIDAARLYSSGKPLAVVDGSRRLVGRLTPERMLAAIAPLSSQPGANSTGAPHV
jgi:hypothetical protein